MFARPEPRLTAKEKLIAFLTVHWRGVVVFLAPLLLIPLMKFPEATKSQICGYCLVLMVIYWVTECIPMPITALIPIIVFPMTNVMNTSKVCSCYINDTIITFVGVMFLGYAFEGSGLHKRLALMAIKLFGYSHYRLLFGISFATMFLSLWITNTAAATLMVPIIASVLKVFENFGAIKTMDTDKKGNKKASKIAICYYCSIAFCSTIGGIGMLQSTVTNLFMKGLFSGEFSKAPELITSPNFSAFTMPLMFALFITTYVYLIVIYFGFLRSKSDEAKALVTPPKVIEAVKKSVSDDLKKLGSVTFSEAMVVLVFIAAVCLFFTRSPKTSVEGWADKLKHYDLKHNNYFTDASTSMCLAFVIFLIPSSLNFLKNITAKYKEDLPSRSETSLLRWQTAHNLMPFSFALVLGAGFALATAANSKYTDLNGKISEVLAKIKDVDKMAKVFIVILLAVVFTNFASNVVVCCVVVPIAMLFGAKHKENPLRFALAGGLSSSFCFCLPIGTPGNMIVKQAASISLLDMAIAGAGPTVCSIMITWILSVYYAPVIWKDLDKFPDWAGGAPAAPAPPAVI